MRSSLPALVALAVWSGCANSEFEFKTGSCESFAQRYVQCMEPEADAAALERRCGQYPIDFEALADCGGQLDCKGFRQCVLVFRRDADPGRRKKRVFDYVTERERAEADGRFQDASTACERLRADPDPGADNLEQCRGLAERAVAFFTARIQLLRDLPRSQFGHLSMCTELFRWSEKVSAMAQDDARELCREAELSIDVSDLTRDIKRRLKDDDFRLPPHCETLVDRLFNIRTTWAIQLQGVLVEQCYVTLGRRVLETRAKKSCPPDVRRVLAAAKRHEITVATKLTALIESAREDCRL